MTTIIVPDRAPFKNDQEFFDAVVTHLRKQGFRAYDRQRGQCVYRQLLPVPVQTPGYGMTDVLMCGVGGVAPDSVLTEAFELVANANTAAVEVLQGAPKFADLMANVSPELVGALQRVHDTEEPANWESALMRLAMWTKLKYTPTTTEVTP